MVSTKEKGDDKDAEEEDEEEAVGRRLGGERKNQDYFKDCFYFEK